MPKLRDVLQKYVPLAETGRKADAAPPPFDSGGLQRDLHALIRHNERFFWIWIGVLVVLFVLCAVLVLRYVDQPGRIQQIFAGAGISFLGVIWRIGDAWKTKMALEFTITLVGGLNENAVRSVVAVLANKIKL